MADFNSKYSGEQVEQLLDMVAGGNAGGGGDIPVISQDIYIAPFTVDDVVSLYNGDIATLSIPIAMIEAAIAKKRVLIPSEYDFGNGFAELIYAEGYVSDTDAGLSAKFFMLRDMYGIYVENTIDGDAITCYREHVDRVFIPDGSTSVGISSIEQTTTSNADGGSNVVTVVLTDGSTSTFTVKNGSKGSQGIQGIQGEQGPKGDTGATGAQGPKGDKGDKGDTGAAGTNGTNGKNGADGEDGATFTPSVDSAGNLSWSNNKGLANPPTVNIKGPKGDRGEGGGGGTGESEIGSLIECLGMTDLVVEEMIPNKRYYLYLEVYNEDGSITIGNFQDFGGSEAANTAEYYAIISIANSSIGGSDAPNISLGLPDVEIRWANGVPLHLNAESRYELSIMCINDYGDKSYNAVITEFAGLL